MRLGFSEMLVWTFLGAKPRLRRLGPSTNLELDEESPFKMWRRLWRVCWQLRIRAITLHR